MAACSSSLKATRVAEAGSGAKVTAAEIEKGRQALVKLVIGGKICLSVKHVWEAVQK